MKNPARGRDGGGNGAPGRIRIAGGRDVPGKGELRVEGDERLIFETPGGGGYGEPCKRDRGRVARDLVQGLVSADEATRIYGSPK